MPGPLRLHGITELPIGTDEVVGEIVNAARMDRGVAIADAALAIGAHEEELLALERGAVSAFGDHERLRRVILAYCDHLDIDPTPLLGRLESYGRWQTVASPDLLAGRPRRDLSDRFGRLLVVLFGLALGSAVFWVVTASL